jgi:predicted  nucleic acid-binding Zn-ribbon protein
MKPTQDTDQIATLTARNIGGIDETEVSISPGVNVLVGRNATNRTSLLRALMAALGSDCVSLKGDAGEGRVELTLGDTTYSRTLTRSNGSISFDGEPYLDSDAAERADLFAFLLETNEARQAVTQQRDLREVIMRPVDTAAIKRQIDELRQEKQEIDAELDELAAQQRKLPDLEQHRARLERQIEEKQEQLAAKEAALEAADTDRDDPPAEQSERDEKLEELRETRATLEDIRLDIETQEESLRALREEHDTLESELTELPDMSEKDRAEIEAEIDRLRNQKQSIDATLNELQTVIQFNEEMLEGTSSDVAAALRDERTDPTESVTDALLDADAHVVCWTCGSEVDTGQIESTLDRLRTLRQDKLGTRNTLTEQIGELEAERQTYEATQRERTQLQQQVTEIESEIESREATLADLRQRRNDLQAEIEQLEETVEELEPADNDELFTLHKEANQFEFELRRLERELEDVEGEIEAIEVDLEQQDQLETRRTEVQTELQNLRSRIEEIETDAVTRFNEHMDAILDRLEYTNLERIWIERVEHATGSVEHQQGPSQFELHIVRRTADGTTYEDTIDHLSESEREVTGLVFALAGYLVHEVYDTLPFIILDSLEAIDSQRIATLVDYLGEYADYLSVALLPEDAAALDDKAKRITEI